MAAPPGFIWPNGAKLAVSLVVNVEEGAEQSILDGDRGPEPVDELGAVPRKPMRVHGNESNYQFGIKVGWPRIRAMLDARSFDCTVTAAARALERAPQIAADIKARGWDVAAHGLRWSHQFWMDEAQERAFITGARDLIEATTGQVPRGWLSRYLHTEATRRILAEEGFTWHMDDYSDEFPFWDSVETATGPKAMVIMPYAIDTNDMKMWVAPALQPWDWARYATDSVDFLADECARDGQARMTSLGLHLRILGRPARARALEAVLDHLAGRDDVWIASRSAIASHFAAHVTSGGGR
jgi:allantoinase